MTNYLQQEFTLTVGQFREFFKDVDPKTPILIDVAEGIGETDLRGIALSGISEGVLVIDVQSRDLDLVTCKVKDLVA